MLFEINDQIEEPDISPQNIECLQIKDLESPEQKTETDSEMLTDTEEKSLEKSVSESESNTKSVLNELDDLRGDITDETKEILSEKLALPSDMSTVEQKVESPNPTEFQEDSQQTAADSSSENKPPSSATKENSVVEKESVEKLVPPVPAEVMASLNQLNSN